jgi:hypothetical protein
VRRHELNHPVEHPLRGVQGYSEGFRAATEPQRPKKQPRAGESDHQPKDGGHGGRSGEEQAHSDPPAPTAIIGNPIMAPFHSAATRYCHPVFMPL